MAYSNLISKVVAADPSNYSKGRAGQKVCKITPHHMAGNLTVEVCGSLFQNPSKKSSSNYGIGTDGRIAGYVDEENRSWCSSSAANDNQAITIEVANNGGSPNWSISEAAFNSLVKLCVDICKRYDFKMEYDNTPNKSLTRHNMFTATTCPGPTLQGRFNELVDKVNAQLGTTPTPAPTPSTEDYILVTSVKGYTNANNAAMRTNSNSTVSPGTYKVFNKASNMINITKTAGTPGWWINPADNVTSTPAPSTGIVAGDTVIVNGIGTGDSYGGGVKTINYRDYTMKVVYVKNDGRPRPYALNKNGNMNGVSGWFTADSVRKA